MAAAGVKRCCFAAVRMHISDLAASEEPGSLDRCCFCQTTHALTVPGFYLHVCNACGLMKCDAKPLASCIAASYLPSSPRLSAALPAGPGHGPPSPGLHLC